MSKSADAFRTISEVAEELDLHKHVLRFWEVKFPQIKPMKRGGGRRYYRPSDLELLRGIRHLLHAEGYTIKGVQKIIREKGIDAVKRVASDTDQPAAKVESAGELPEVAAAVGGGRKTSQTRDASRILEAADGVAARSRAPEADAKAKPRGHAAPMLPVRLSAAQRKIVLTAIDELRACRVALTSEPAVVAMAAVEAAKAKRAG